MGALEMSGQHDTVPRNALGTTGLSVSTIGFGASPLGGVFGPVDAAAAHRAVHAAIDHGVNFFDVAPYYGLTRAETRLGEALDGHRHKVLLATKCGRYGESDFDFSAGAVTEGLHASLLRLRTDYVDLLQVHDVEFGDERQIVEETLPALVKLREQGKARHIGITGYIPLKLLRIAQQFQPETILNYCHWNLLNREMDGELTPFAESRSIGLINASPLHMGLLTDAGPPGWHPAPPAVLAAGRRAAEFCAARGLSLPEIALRFCLQHPYVSTTLIGIASEQQLQQNLRALAPSNEADAALGELDALLQPELNINWHSGLEPLAAGQNET